MTTQILLDRFEIETQLSCTDFSTVYLGCDRKYTHRPHCLITAIPYRQREIRHRLEREAQILERLGHHTQIPSQLTYFHRGESKTEGTFYIVEDHIDGHALSKELTTPDRAPKQLSEGYVAKLLRDTLTALTFAHEQGIVHQNLHPQNLIRQKHSGHIFLTGFSAIAKLARSQITADGTLSSSVPTTPSAYIAPEQLRALSMARTDAKSADSGAAEQSEKKGPQPASDLYALGLIAIEALTGKRHTEFEYVAGSGLKWREGVEVSLPLAEFIDRLIRQDWRDRFDDAKEALKTLEHQQHRHSIANDSRLPTVVAAPGLRYAQSKYAQAKYAQGATAIAANPNAIGHSSGHLANRSAGRSRLSTGSYALSTPHPYFYKFVIGSVAAIIALGIGVKTYQWGEYRVSKLPQTWQDWRDRSDKLTPADPQTLVPLLEDGSIMLQPAAAKAFWQMVAAAKEENIALYPLAGHRESSDDLYDYATGYAIDIGGAEASVDKQVSFAQTTEFQWLKRHAKTHGFELSTPKDRLLGGAFEEPWHWRYMGDEASKEALGL